MKWRLNASRNSASIRNLRITRIMHCGANMVPRLWAGMSRDRRSSEKRTRYGRFSTRDELAPNCSSISLRKSPDPISGILSCGSSHFNLLYRFFGDVRRPRAWFESYKTNQRLFRGSDLRPAIPRFRWGRGSKQIREIARLYGKGSLTGEHLLNHAQHHIEVVCRSDGTSLQAFG